MSLLLAKIAQIHRSAAPAVTWNPSDKSSSLSLSAGNLTATASASNTWVSARATLGRDAATANHYFETTFTASNFITGVVDALSGLEPSGYIGQSNKGYGLYNNGNKMYNGGGTAYTSPFSSGSIVGILLKNGKVYFRLNGTWLNSADPIAETGWAFNGVTGIVFPGASIFTTSETFTGMFNAASISGSLPSGTSVWGS